MNRDRAVLVLVFAIFAVAAPLAAREGTADFVEVSGRRIYIDRKGSGSPAVVFVSGLGEDSTTWSKVQPEISRESATLSYDRCGIGRSETGLCPPDARGMSGDLRKLLERAGVAPPYVLVGHSLGADVALIFAHDFPAETAGMVLVDPGYRESSLRARVSPAQWSERESRLARYESRMNEAQKAEKDSLETSGLQAEKALPISGIPVVLLSGMQIDAAFPAAAQEREVKLESHRNWLSKISGGAHVRVPESRHYIQTEVPAAVIEAIRSVRGRIGSAKAPSRRPVG
jgi:pimeloyl-ACP methyl ester carboxylesterase